MTARPRGHGEAPSTAGRGADSETASPRPRAAGAGSVAQAHDALADLAERGRATVNRTGVPAAPPDDIELRQAMHRYDQLGAEPPKFTIAANDNDYAALDAHTVERHGPDITLRRDPNEKTIEGRIYGDQPWGRPANRSYRWTDHTTMNREVNEYVRRNWDAIRSDLAVDGRHESGFDAQHRVGVGFHNTGMYGAGPRQAGYGVTSLVLVRIELVPGSDPPVPFIVSAFPTEVL